MKAKSDKLAVSDAALLALVVHSRQQDKAGEPYIGHARRVSELVRYFTDDFTVEERNAAKAAAWLHDVIEDGPFGMQTVIEDLFSSEVSEAVNLLTRRGGNESYYPAIKENKIARAVKLADMTDNTDPTRLSKLAPQTRDRLIKKYNAGFEALGAAGLSVLVARGEESGYNSSLSAE